MKGKLVRLTKIGEVDKPLHPHNIMIGQVYEGTMEKEPTLNERFNLNPISTRPGQRGISTSGVLKILSEDTFETYSSVYKWEVIDENN